MFAELQLDDIFAFEGVSIYAKKLACARIENFDELSVLRGCGEESSIRIQAQLCDRVVMTLYLPMLSHLIEQLNENTALSVL